MLLSATLCCDIMQNAYGMAFRYFAKINDAENDPFRTNLVLSGGLESKSNLHQVLAFSPSSFVLSDPLGWMTRS